MTTIQDAITTCTNAFKTVSDTAHLDAEVLVAHAASAPPTRLFSHPEAELTQEQEQNLRQLTKRRLQGEPIAYIIEHKEFWELELKVTPDVLIPRPETECLVEWIVEHHPKGSTLKVADLGVGSGAIALALAKEHPQWTIHATDYSHEALLIARENANNHNLHNVHFFHGEWCEPLPKKDYDIIVSNPPYIDSHDKHLNHLSFEPKSALDGGKSGLDDIKIIIHQAKNYLKKSGLLIFEHGFDQRETILTFLNETRYNDAEDHNDLAGLPRFATALKE